MVGDLFQPESLVGLAGLSVVLFWLIVGNVRGWYVPGPTHRREIAARDAQIAQAIKDRDDQITATRLDLNARMENFRADHAIRVDASREDHRREIDGVRSDMAAIIAGKQREADDWRTAFHIRDENAKIAEEKLNAIMEFIRFAQNTWQALQRISGEQPPHTPQLPGGGSS